MSSNLTQTRIMGLLAALIAVGLVVTPLFVPPASAQQAQQPTLDVSLEAGYGDEASYVIGEWFPIHVRLTNPAGAPGGQVRVEVDAQGQSADPTGSYGRELDLPSQSRKDVTLYTYSAAFTSAFTVRVIRDGKVIASKQVKVNPIEHGTNMLVGVISSDASLLNALNSETIGHVPTPFNGSPYYGGYYSGPSPSGTPTGARVTVAHIALDDLPLRGSALNSFAVLVLDDADAGALTDEQYAAMLDWISRGGTLVIAARPGGADLPKQIANLLPVQIAGTRTLDSLDGLGDFVNVPITLTAPVLATNSTLKTAPSYGARLMASQDGVPLVAMRNLGEGRVVYMALSPALAPLKGWDGLTPLFKRLLVEYKLNSTLSSPAFWSSVGYGYSSFGQTPNVFVNSGGLFDLPVLDLPEPLGIAMFLLVYILIVGPVNFIVLRRMRRAELAWITVPALVLLFSVGAYLIGREAKGGHLIMIRANTVYSVPDSETSSARQFVGLFSPVRGNYRLAVGADSLTSEMSNDGRPNTANPVRVTGGSPTVLDDVQISTSSLRAFMAENTPNQKSPLEADLHIGDNLIVGKVRNRSSGGLRDVALIRGGAVWNINYLAPGASADVKMPVSTSAFDNSTPENVLPAPPGVNTYSGGYYSYNSSEMPPEVREYNRKVILLNAALAPLLSADPPSDMDVVALAWGTNAPVNVNVEGQFAQTEDLSLWTSRVPITAEEGGETPRLALGSVPFRTYVPRDAGWYAGQPPSSTNLGQYGIFSQHYDVQFALPAGVKPEKLSLVIDWPRPDGLELRMYNVQSGEWDLLTAASNDPSVNKMVMSPGNAANYADYVNPSGTVTVRMQSISGDHIQSPIAIEMALNN